MTTIDDVRNVFLLLLATGPVGGLLWLVLRWASRRAIRRIWLVSVPIWLAYVYGTGRLGAALDERSVLAVAGEIPFALFQLVAASAVAIVVYFFAHWLAHGSLRDADPDD